MTPADKIKDTAVGNPLLRSLPDLLLVPMADVAGVEPAFALRPDEAFARRAGCEAAINLLVEPFAVLLLHHAVDAMLVEGGVLAAPAGALLGQVMTASRQQPERAWSVPPLARVFARGIGSSHADWLASVREGRQSWFEPAVMTRNFRQGGATIRHHTLDDLLDPHHAGCRRKAKPSADRFTLLVTTEKEPPCPAPLHPA